MRNLLAHLGHILAPMFACLLPHSTLQAQNSNLLWDDSRVSAIHVTIPQDSLDSLLADTYGTHYFLSEIIFDDGLNRDTLAQVGLRLRGNTSRLAAKKSFKLSFNTYQPGRRYQAVKKLNLNGAHNDPTMIREKLFYDTWNRAGMPPRRTTFVKLHINGVYRGLYTCLEEIDKDWLMRAFADNGGNLYKCTYPADLAYIGADPNLYKALGGSNRTYDLQTNETLDDYSDLAQLIALLDQVPGSAFETQIQQSLNVQGFLRALAIDVATGNWDDYAYNKNNYFLYHHLGNGQFQFFTYDTDNTFGVDFVGRDWATRNCDDWISHGSPRPLAEKLLAIPAWRFQYLQALDTISRHITCPDSIFPRIDAMRALILSAAVSDTFRSLDYGYTMADFELGFTGTVDGHTPYGIKPFLSARCSSTTAQLTIALAEVAQILPTGLILSPNPSTNSQDIWLSSKLPPTQDLQISLINAQGQLLGQWTWPAHQPSFRIPAWDSATGVFLLRIQARTQAQVIRILRQ